MSGPLVSVICLCYQHGPYVREAVRSVMQQTYPNIELIVVDDHSTDGSADVLVDLKKEYPSIKLILLEKNLGNCRAFNRGWREANGAFIIDLSADDVLMPNRVKRGVEVFLQSEPDTGVQFSDAILVDGEGKSLGKHSDRFPHHTIPQGDIYVELIKRYFVCSPTMMIRQEVMTELNGYDEHLWYEDFDFWIRSARLFKYVYTAEPLIRRRILRDSMGRQQYRNGSKYMWSTLEVCQKILSLNKTTEENKALKKRIFSESRQALKAGMLSLMWEYSKLLRKIPR